MYSFSKIVGQYCTSAWKEERHNTNLLSASLLPNNSQGWVEVRSLKPTGSLSCGWQGTHMLGPRLMPPSCILAGSWVGSGARTQTPALWYMRYGVPKCLLLFALFTVTHVRHFFLIVYLIPSWRTFLLFPTYCYYKQCYSILTQLSDKPSSETTGSKEFLSKILLLLSNSA